MCVCLHDTTVVAVVVDPGSFSPRVSVRCPSGRQTVGSFLVVIVIVVVVVARTVPDYFSRMSHLRGWGEGVGGPGFVDSEVASERGLLSSMALHKYEGEKLEEILRTHFV